MIGPAEIFALFFVMLGPIKVLAPFVQRTRGLDEEHVRRIAWWAFVIATVAVVLGSLLGRALLANWRVSDAALLLAAGIVFFLVALRQLLEQYAPSEPAPAETLPASPAAAASRLVFPMLLTPYGMAAVIALLATDLQRTALVLGLAVLMMVLDLFAMLYARRILAGFMVIVLQVLGSVLAVLQVAMSVQLILGGLRALGILQS